MKPRRLLSDTSLSITSGWVLAGMVRRSGRDEDGAAGCGAGRAARGERHTPNPGSYSGIELRAQAGRRRDGPAEEPGHDPVAMEAPVLDEHLVRVVPGHHHPGDEQPGYGRLQRFR